MTGMIIAHLISSYVNDLVIKKDLKLYEGLERQKKCFPGNRNNLGKLIGEQSCIWENAHSMMKSH